MVQSLTKSAAERNRHLPPSQFIYDNFDMDFKVAQPTAGSRGSHASMTSATFAPYADLRPGDLMFTKELHAKSRFNKDLSPNPRIPESRGFCIEQAYVGVNNQDIRGNGAQVPTCR